MSLKTAQKVAVNGASFETIKVKRVFPPQVILNAYFQTGKCVRIDGSYFNWTPFTLNEIQYNDFHYWCTSNWGDLVITDFSCHDDNHEDWFNKAADS